MSPLLLGTVASTYKNPIEYWFEVPVTRGPVLNVNHTYTNAGNLCYSNISSSSNSYVTGRYVQQDIYGNNNKVWAIPLSWSGISAQAPVTATDPNNGSFYVYNRVAQSAQPCRLVKYDVNGSYQWGLDFYGAVGIALNKIVFDSSSNLYVSWNYVNSQSDNGTYLTKLNPANGAIIWQRKIISTVFAQWCITLDMELNPYNNRLYLGIQSNTAGGVSGIAVYDLSGNLIYMKDLPTTMTYQNISGTIYRQPKITSIGFDSSGNVYVVNALSGGSFSRSTINFVFKLDSSFNIVWTRQFANITGSDTDGSFVNGLTDANGNTYIWSYMTTTGSQVYILCINASGTLTYTRGFTVASSTTQYVISSNIGVVNFTGAPSTGAWTYYYYNTGFCLDPIVPFSMFFSIYVGISTTNTYILGRLNVDGTTLGTYTAGTETFQYTAPTFPTAFTSPTGLSMLSTASFADSAGALGAGTATSAINLSITTLPVGKTSVA